MKIGIIGLPKSGKTTVFYALARGHTTGVSSHKEHVNIASVKLEDERLKALSSLLHPKKITPAYFELMDFEGQEILSKTHGRGVLISELKKMSALLEIVRHFEYPSCPHPLNSIEPERDIKMLQGEIILEDLAIVDGKLSRVEKSKEKISELEEHALRKCKEWLEKEIPLRECDLKKDEVKSISGYCFLSLLPLVRVHNIGEDSLKYFKIKSEGKKRTKEVGICCKLEMELSALSEEEEIIFLKEWEMQEPGTNEVIKACFEVLELLSFFTIVSDEVKAWTLTSGTNALGAAGKIHSDIERGFIKAEVISVENLLEAGSIAKAREHGWVRLEGKEYIVKDGDVVTFRFNV